MISYRAIPGLATGWICYSVYYGACVFVGVGYGCQRGFGVTVPGIVQGPHEGRSHLGVTFGC
jgi:hypothetical protein